MNEVSEVPAPWLDLRLMGSLFGGLIHEFIIGDADMTGNLKWKYFLGEK